MRPVIPEHDSLRLRAVLWPAALLIVGMLVPPTANCQTPKPIEDTPPAQRCNYHTPPGWTPSLMKDQHKFSLISPLVREGGQRVSSPQQWYRELRPQLIGQWTRILGKLGPEAADRKWFGDISQVEIRDTQQREGYTRIDLGIPIEQDFVQDHLLLLPKGQGPGPFPAVIAWTSTTPDYTRPEQWWGAWLARRGYVVLTSWSFIRHYRGGANYRKRANELVYERFGHWLPMAKMVHDVQREVEFLRTRPEVDAGRVGFIGFSLSGKAALYVAAFAPEIIAAVAVDPHVSLHGDTNYHDPWYLDWKRKFSHINTDDYPLPELRGTIWSLLDADPTRSGFERNHHEMMALCAPRALLLIGCSMDKASAVHSDDMQSWGYFNRAREVYELLGIPDRIELFATDEGHRATSPRIDAAWQKFFERWLKARPVRFAGYEAMP